MSFFAVLAYEGAEEAGEPPLVMLERRDGKIRISTLGGEWATISTDNARALAETLADMADRAAREKILRDNGVYRT